MLTNASKAQQSWRDERGIRREGQGIPIRLGSGIGIAAMYPTVVGESAIAIKGGTVVVVEE